MISFTKTHPPELDGYVRGSRRYYPRSLQILYIPLRRGHVRGDRHEQTALYFF